MFSRIAAQFRSRALWLLAGRIDEIVAEHQFPLPVDFGDSRLIVRSPDEARTLLGHLRAAYVRRGVAALVPMITAVDLPRGGRFRVWVDWHSAPHPGGPTHLASAVYYCRQVPAGMRIEMVDCTSLAIPDLQPELAALALSA
jgi:hypothetical protein